MLRIELRQMFRSNGLIDDFVVYGKPEDYVHFSERVKSAMESPAELVLGGDRPVRIEISEENETGYLFTSLQNENDQYLSMQDWESRSVLRVIGSEAVLRELCAFLLDLSGRGEGYSYISQFSETYKYADLSPEWRLHVEKS